MAETDDVSRSQLVCESLADAELACADWVPGGTAEMQIGRAVVPALANPHVPTSIGVLLLALPSTGCNVRESVTAHGGS